MLTWVSILVLMIQESASHTAHDRSVIHEKSTGEYITFSLVAIFCVLFGGLMSGLTVGLLGIDELDLELKLSSGSPQEKINARKVLNVINHHHLLLVTLLISNSIAMEALPLFLDEIFNTELSILISVTFVLAFGEVIPQAVCTGANQMKIATTLIPFVKVLMVILLPLSYPIAKLLDWLLDHNQEGNKMNPDDLKTFISLHQSFSIDSTQDKEAGLEKFQITMMHGIIDLSRIKAKQAMKPYKSFLRLDVAEPVSFEEIEKISSSLHSTLLVYKGKKNNVVGVIKPKDVFQVWKGGVIEDSDIEILLPIFVDHNMNLMSVLKEMENKAVSVAMVTAETEKKSKVIGVTTKELIMGKVLCSANMTERNEIADISHALVDTLNKKNEKNQKVKTPLRDNLLS